MLLVLQADRKDLGQPQTDPAGVVEARFNALVQAVQLLNQVLERGAHGNEFRRQRNPRLRRHLLDVADPQSVGLLGRGVELKPERADGQYPQQAAVALEPVGNDGKRSNPAQPGLRRRLAVFLDPDHAERFVVAHAPADHVHVAGFENPQGQRAFRKKDRGQGEQRGAGAHAPIICRPAPETPVSAFIGTGLRDKLPAFRGSFRRPVQTALI